MSDLIYTIDVNFAEFITKKYVQWRGDETRNTKSIARYARDVLGISPQLLNDWMSKGKMPTEEKYIELLLRVFEKDKLQLYELLGLPIPLESLPPDIRAQFSAALLELNAATASKRIKDPESPEGRKQVLELLEKFGIDVTIIE